MLVLEELNFKKDGDGYLFFPYGMLTKGYRVDEAAKAELTTVIRRFYLYAFPALLVSIGADSIWLAILALPAFGYYAIKIRRLLHGVPQTDTRLRLADSAAAMVRATGMFGTVFMIVSGALLSILFAFVLYLGVQNGDLKLMLLGSVCLPFGGLAFVLGMLMARSKQAPPEHA